MDTNNSRILRSMSLIDNALSSLEIVPLKEFNIKNAKTALRGAKTLLKNSKTDLRFLAIEQDIEILKKAVLKEVLK